jgi:hypothetical protein
LNRIVFACAAQSGTQKRHERGGEARLRRFARKANKKPGAEAGFLKSCEN